MNQDEFKTLLGFSASVSTILQFLSGTIICLQIVKKGTTGEISPFPFVSGALSTTLWLRYGFLIQETPMILVNTVGATLFFSYVLVFYIFSIKKSLVLKQFLACVLLLVIALSYTQYQNNTSEVIEFMGLLCSCVTILFFASPLISLAHIIKMKSSESLPFPIILTTFIVSVQWFLYGVILNDRFIQVPNFLGCVLSAFQLTLFCIYPKKYKPLDEV